MVSRFTVTLGVLSFYSLNRRFKEFTLCEKLKDCEDPVCQSKMDLFKNAVKFTRTRNMKDETATGAMKVDCPVDKDTLGYNSWTLLHTLAAHFPDKPSSEQQSYAHLFFKSLAFLYPCKVCALDFQDSIRNNEPITTSRKELSLWVCRLHNEVNSKLGKESFPCDITLLDERWRKSGSKSCNVTEMTEDADEDD